MADRIICTNNDVVHVTGKPRSSNHGYMDNNKTNITQHDQKMDGTRTLAIAKQFGEPVKPVFNRRRHRHPGEHSQWRPYKYDTEVSKLLQRIKVIKSIELNRHMQSSVMHKYIPAFRKDAPGYGYQAFPLVGKKQHK